MQGIIDELRFTVDAAGNALVPIDWRGVLVENERVPIPRLVRGQTDFPAFPGGVDPVSVPGRSFLASYSPEGHRLPPIFEPLEGGARTGSACSDRPMVRSG